MAEVISDFIKKKLVETLFWWSGSRALSWGYGGTQGNAEPDRGCQGWLWDLFALDLLRWARSEPRFPNNNVWSDFNSGWPSSSTGHL